MADVQPVLDYFHAAYAPETVGLVPHKNIKLHVPPSQFARASAVSYGPGPKACAQCGTTRTPQWREGPEGPKTLCNACGVKRVRQMRTVMDGNKRRSNTNISKSSSALLRQESMEPQISDSLDLQRQDSYYKRPVRRAAARAACRTAEFASTGEWLEDEEDVSYPYISSQSTGSADSAENHSDSAEEVAWIPQHRAAHPMPPSPMGTATAVGVECAAAVNLLSMSVHDSELRRHHASRPAALAHAHASASVSSREPCKVNADSYLQMTNVAMKWNYAMPPHAKAADSIQETLRLLPEEKHSELLTIKEELDTSSREAAAADAAVAAVAKILAMKQAAAIRARTAASCAAKRMHEFMADLDEEYHWSRNPKKPRSL